MTFDDAFLEKFFSRIDIPSLPNGEPDKSQCWLWTGAKTAGGGKDRWPYGCVRYRGRVLRAHRVALAIHTGEMPADKDAAHSERCVSGLCCNSSHLEWQEPVRNRYDEIVRRYRERLAAKSAPVDF